ncbi:Biorientation of chromosome in cell division protein 1 [Taenia solium]|eukprot:TsM_000698000 transcript=TsM_000698000 gene=TsM_000698000
MKEPPNSHLPTSEMLVTKLKSQGFFDKIRKRCLENVETNSEYIYLKHNFVDRIVSQFLSTQYPTGNKLELRDQLRRRLQGNASFQHSLRQMSDLLLAAQASPESLAPSINQVTCEALNVDYHEWLKMSQKRRTPQPMVFSGSASPPKHMENPAPLLPNPSSISTNREPLLPTSSALDLENQQGLLEENDVEMEVDDVGDEMEVESTDSNVGTGSSQTQRPSKYLSTNTFVSEAMPHNDIGQTVSSYDNKSPLTMSPAAMRNSSSFSRKISTAAAGWAVPVPREQLDVVSDNETMGEYSPLRRRMSLTGNSGMILDAEITLTTEVVPNVTIETISITIKGNIETTVVIDIWTLVGMVEVIFHRVIRILIDALMSSKIKTAVATGVAMIGATETHPQLNHARVPGTSCLALSRPLYFGVSGRRHLTRSTLQTLIIPILTEVADLMLCEAAGIRRIRAITSSSSEKGRGTRAIVEDLVVLIARLHGRVPIDVTPPPILRPPSPFHVEVTFRPPSLHLASPGVLSSTRTSNASSSDLVKPQLLNNVELGVVTIWYNNIGRIIHVGGILPIHLPMIAPGEKDYELSRVASAYEGQNGRTTLELPKAYAIDLGSSLDTLHRKTMTTVTCRTYRSQGAGLLKSELLVEKPFSMKEELIHNQYSLMHYVQPLVIWKYVIPEHPLVKGYLVSDWWRDEAEVFCRRVRNVREFQVSPCLTVSMNQITAASSAKHETLLSLTINLSSNPMNILSDPISTNLEGNITLSYIHAVTKSLLDRHFMEAVSRNLTFHNVSTEAQLSISTSADIICPTGTQLKHPPTPLPPISFTYPMNISLQSVDGSPISPTESAYVLATVSLSCEACPSGQAPRTPYSFAPCTPCPRGLYRGDTGWPSTSGCLHCPAGFTTLREGSTSPDDCVIDGGALTRAMVGFAVWAYHNFMELIVAAHEASMSYTKRAKLYLGEESKMGVAEGSVHWINRIKPAALAVGIFYSLLVLLLLALAVYRLLLIYHFKRTHSKHMYLLRKSIVIGQLNSQDDAKDLLRQDFARVSEINLARTTV